MAYTGKVGPWTLWTLGLQTIPLDPVLILNNCAGALDLEIVKSCLLR